MKKIYQKISSPENGDCLKAAIASLFEEDYDNVPHFIETDSWFENLRIYCLEKGYKFEEILHNKNWSMLQSPTYGCFNVEKWEDSLLMSKHNMETRGGINGLFLATVLSPNYFTFKNIATHAVLIDKGFNIVHDPCEGYKDILKYPLSDILEYNGVIAVWDFKKVI